MDILSGRLEWNKQDEAERYLSDLSARHPDWPQVTLEDTATQHLVLHRCLKWPPPTDRLIGIEAKCAYNANEDVLAVMTDDIKAPHASKGDQKDIQKKMRILQRMGFDRTILIDFIANPPLGGTGILPWFDAIDLADSSLKAFLERNIHSNSDDGSAPGEKVLDGRLAADSDSGHFVLPIAAVEGGDEGSRGGGRTDWPIQLRPPEINTLLSHSPTEQNRKEMESNLEALLSTLPVPQFLPVIIVACSACGQLYFYNRDMNADRFEHCANCQVESHE